MTRENSAALENPAPKTSRVAHLLFLPVLAAGVLSAVMGVDFGWHWDESNHFQWAAHAIESRSPLPGSYIYPSVCFDIILLALAPEAARYRVQEGRQGLARHLMRLAKSLAFRLHVRRLFIFLAYLAPVWTYLLVWLWRKNKAQAFLAAALLSASWEINYHSRWVAPDAILMQFGALSVWLAFRAIESKRARWLGMAAGAAGLACSTKYPAGLLLAPVFLAARLMAEERRLRPRAVLLILAAFGASYLLTTPGTVLEAGRFISDVRSEIEWYGRGHLGYTVAPVVEHIPRMLEYLAFVAFSRCGGISLFFFSLSLIGAAVMLREDRERALIFLSFPVLYAAYFGSQKVMIARNLLILLPFLAVAAAEGFCFLQKRWLAGPGLRFLLPAAAALSLTLNSLWLFEAAVSIRRRGSLDYAVELLGFVEKNAGAPLLLSRRVARDLSSLGAKNPPPPPARPLGPDVQALFYASEVVDQSLWRANRRGYVTEWFGPHEVNFNCYPTWQGDDRVVLMDAKSAQTLGLFRD